MFYFEIFFVLCAICLFLFICRNNNYRIERFDKKISFVAVVFMIILASFRFQIGLDYFPYETSFQLIKCGDYGIFNLDVEPLFWLLNKIAPSFRFVLIITAVIGIGLKGRYYIRNVSFSTLAVLMYFASCFMFYDMGIMRQGLSMGIAMLGLRYIELRDVKKFLVTIVIASLFHITALLIIPLYFLGKKNINKVIYFLLPPTAYVISDLCIKALGWGLSVVHLNSAYHKFLSYTRVLKNNSVSWSEIIIRYAIFITLMVLIEYVSKDSSTKQRDLNQIWINGIFLGVVEMAIFANVGVMSVRGTSFLYFLQIPVFAELSYQKKNQIVAILAMIVAIIFYFRTMYNTLCFSSGATYIPYKMGL